MFYFEKNISASCCLSRPCYTRGMTTPLTHCLWARFAEPLPHGTALHTHTPVVHPFNYCVEFIPVPRWNNCHIVLHTPDSPVWKRTPIIGVLERGFGSGHGHITIRTSTARVTWGLLVRSGWHTSPADTAFHAPITLLSPEQLHAFTQVHLPRPQTVSP